MNDQQPPAYQPPRPADEEPQPVSAQVVSQPTGVTESDTTLRLIAFILSLISTISVGWLIIPLLWMVPMTIISWGIYKGTKRNTTAFGVCTLLFLNFIAGILLLVSKKDR